MLKKICPVCGKEFEPVSITHKYCSYNCSKYGSRQFIVICKTCGEICLVSNYDYLTPMKACSQCGSKDRIIRRCTDEERKQVAEGWHKINPEVLNKEYQLKKDFITAYNEDHNSETLTDVNNVDIEVAKEYMNNRVVEEPVINKEDVEELLTKQNKQVINSINNSKEDIKELLKDNQEQIIGLITDYNHFINVKLNRILDLLVNTVPCKNEKRNLLDKLLNR